MRQIIKIMSVTETVQHPNDLLFYRDRFDWNKDQISFSY